ncbi:MAG: type II toxin-antitoxin system RelE/ParE family toxin [Verrucomicrobiaceae bacterium]
MSLPISIALRAEQDMALQYGWYLENADLEVAERYLSAIDQTIQRLASYPDLGMRRHFQSPELEGVRSFQAARPFNKHLIFYQAGNQLNIERVMHGARDFPRRLLEEP